MRKIFSGFVMGVLMVSLVLGGCAAPAPSPAPTTAPAPAPAPAPSPSAPAPAPSSSAPAAKPIVLRFAVFNPPGASNSGVMVRWADMVDKQSGGRLKFQLYFSESLAKQTEVYRATQTGVADIAFTTIGTDVSITPLSAVTRLPFIGMPSMSAAPPIWWALYNKFPEIQKEWQGMKPLAVTGLPPDQPHFTKKEVRLPADMKGMKIVARGELPDVVKSIGAAPVDLPTGDWYTGLDRGLVEGIIIHFLVLNSFKILPLCNYNTIVGESGVSQTSETYIMNLNTWNSLPPDLQKIVESTGLWFQDEVIKMNTQNQQQAIEYTKSLKKTFTYLTPEELKIWMDAGKARQNSWIAENEAKGLPAKAVYNETLRLIQEYSK